MEKNTSHPNSAPSRISPFSYGLKRLLLCQPSSPAAVIKGSSKRLMSVRLGSAQLTIPTFTLPFLVIYSAVGMCAVN